MEQADRSGTQVDAAATRHIVTFRLAGETLCLPVEQVGQVLPMLAITPLPESTGTLLDSLLSVINLHGQIVPVLDMACHLGLPQATLDRDTLLIVTRVGAQTLALVVDEVIDVLGVRPIDVTPAREALPPSLGPVPALAGLVRPPWAGARHLALLLDPDHLLSPEQRQALARALELLRERVTGARAGVP